MLTIALPLCLAAPGALTAGCSAGARSVAARSRPPSAIALAQARHQYPAPPPPPERAAAASSTAASAVRDFASAYINWEAGTVSSDLRRLAQRSIGEARAAMELAAAQTASDYELRADGIANHGEVEAVARLPGHPDEYVVVTREQTTATGTSAYEGLAPAWHVALASVAELGPGAYAVSAWQPQS